MQKSSASTSSKLVIATVLALGAFVALAVAAVGWFVLRSDNPAEVSLRDRSAESASASEPTTNTADGTWTVQQDPQVFVGYRINELFAGDAIKKEAVGRTPAVSGSMTISGQQVSSVEITADMTQLKSDQGARDNFLKNKGLETAKFTQATFRSAAPVQLPAPPVRGQKLSVNVAGDLTVHGKTKKVTVPLDAVWNGSTVDVSGKIDIDIADFGIEKVSVAVANVDTKGQLEMALSFVPGAVTEAAASAAPSTTTAPTPANGAPAPSTSKAPASPTTKSSGGYGDYPSTKKSTSGGY